MKKKIYLLSMLLMLVFTTGQIKAATVISNPAPKETALSDEQKHAKIEAIKERLNEIKAMDKSNLSKEQKQDLKAELKNMKAEARAAGGGGGIYLSVGAIIIIILLLILILK